MKLSVIPSDTHEAIYRVEDRSIGLSAIIAVHSTQLGPAAGGLRMRPYPSFDAALEDAKRLSHGMTYKNAAAGLPLGGGKAVIIGNPATEKTPDILRAFGRGVDALAGRYITAEDMGMTPRDMATIAKETEFVAGLPDGDYASGDPSPITARGIFNSLQTTYSAKFGSKELHGRVVAVQGLGHVGWHLCKMLKDAGASLIVADTNTMRVEQAIQTFDAKAVEAEEIYNVHADIFAPCAIGGILNARTIPQLKATVVTGGANNQLATSDDAQALHERGILYAPDFVVNGGGIINVATEILKIRDRDVFVAQKLEALDRTLVAILTEANSRNVSPDKVAVDTVDRAMNSPQAAE